MRKILAALAAAALLLSANPGRAAATDSHLYTNADVGFAESIYQKVDPGPRLDREKAYAGNRTPIVRVDLDWYWLEPTSCPGTCIADWSGIDDTVNAAVARGFRVLLILDYAPSWANGGMNAGHYYPTRDHDADWVDLVDAAVAHFGDKVQAYEIWNEPNQMEFGDFVTPGNDEARVPERKKRYWELVKLAYPRIKAGCPTCVVLAGGSGGGGTPAGPASSASAWLQAGYDQGARNYFDAVTHHPYYNAYYGVAWTSCAQPWLVPMGMPYRVENGAGCGLLSAVRNVMVANNDAGKKIWGTEYGLPTRDTDRPDDSLTRVANMQVDGVRLWRSVDWTGPLFLFTFQDAVCPGDPPTGGCHYGVETNDGSGGHQPKSPLFEQLGAALRDEWPDRLHAHQSLFENAKLISQDGRFVATIRPGDGELVLYATAGGSVTTPFWTAGVNLNTKATRLVNQADGVLQLLDRQDVSVWHGSWYGHVPDTLGTLIMQNDGNLVLYRDTDAKVLWASDTCCR